MHAGAKLPVPDAEAAIPAMARLVRWAADRDVTHLATADDHELTDPELSGEPDYVSTFPPHCLRGTPGAAKIAETLQRDPLPLSLTPYPPGHIPKLVEGRRELLVLKKTYSAFSNPNLDAAARDPRPVGGDPLRRCHGRLQPRGRPGPARTGISRRLRRGRLARSLGGAGRGVSRGVARGRRPVHDERRGGRVDPVAPPLVARAREAAERLGFEKSCARRGRAPAARPGRRGAGSSGSPRSAPAPVSARRGSQPLWSPGHRSTPPRPTLRLPRLRRVSSAPIPTSTCFAGDWRDRPAASRALRSDLRRRRACEGRSRRGARARRAWSDARVGRLLRRLARARSPTRALARRIRV